jgi:hypothetical protein
MRIILFSFLAGLSAINISCAGGTTNSNPGTTPTQDTVRVPSSKLACEETAFDVISYVDKAGWGKTSEPLKVLSGAESKGAQVFRIASPVSGYSYTITMMQDMKSEACFVLEITSK